MDLFASEAVVARGKDEVRISPHKKVSGGLLDENRWSIVQDLSTGEVVVARGKHRKKWAPDSSAQKGL